KLIVHGADRPQALARLRDALARCEIAGPKSNVEFLERLVRHPAVVNGTIDTGYLDRHLDEFLAATGTDDERLLLAAVTARLVASERAAAGCNAASGDPTSPWAHHDGWRIDGPALSRIAVLHRGERLLLRVGGHSGRYRIEHAGRIHAVDGVRLEGERLSLRLDGEALSVRVGRTGGAWSVHDGARRLALHDAPLHDPRHGGAESGADRVVAPMPGRVVLARVTPGDAVTAGQELMVIEAMKMELSLKAPRDGVVAEVRGATGDFVEADAALVILEAAS
ncbi:biotin/lipoyl-containing protein, partial [Lysobacter xanthus]